MRKLAAFLILPLWLVETGCGFNWEVYVDAALYLEETRQAAEVKAGSVKATFGPDDPVYVKSRALYEEARSESARTLIDLSYSIFRKASPQTVQGRLAESTAKAEIFMRFADESIGQRLAPGTRGPLTSLLKASVLPLIKRTYGSATRPNNVQSAVKMIEDAVTWRSWEGVR